MRKDASAIPLGSTPVEPRRVPRKSVRFSGVIADESGENAIDCTIRDLNACGAQVELSTTLQHDAGIYLVDTHNEMAHLATVVWMDTDRAGLSFLRSYSLELTLPRRLKFLGRLLIEAKLREVKTLVERGVPVEEAIRIVGVSGRYLDRFGMRGVLDEKVCLLLHQAKRLLSK